MYIHSNLHKEENHGRRIQFQIEKYQCLPVTCNQTERVHILVVEEYREHKSQARIMVLL